MNKGLTSSQYGHLHLAVLKGFGQSSNEDVHTLLLFQPPNVSKQRHRCIHLQAGFCHHLSALQGSKLSTCTESVLHGSNRHVNCYCLAECSVHRIICLLTTVCVRCCMLGPCNYLHVCESLHVKCGLWLFACMCLCGHCARAPCQVQPPGDSAKLTPPCQQSQ